HYLLDEFIDEFYEVSGVLGASRRVRRPAEEGSSCRGGRASLLALKRHWAADWEFENIWQRLMRSGQLLPEPRALLVHPGGESPLPVAVAQDASAILGQEVELLGTAEGEVT